VSAALARIERQAQQPVAQAFVFTL
jgi:hypothetical protein